MSEKAHYYKPEYLRRERLQAYIDQITVIREYSSPQDSILEVGKGNGYLSHFISNYLEQPVKTLDISPELEPDYCGDISSPNFILPEKFDIGVCFEVLEHIPLTQVPTAIQNLQNQVRNYVIVSVPDTNFFVQFKLNILWLLYSPLAFTLSVPRFLANRKTAGADHEWEIGIKKGNGGKRVSKKILLREFLTGSECVQNFRGREFPGHHFFVFRGSGE